MKFFGVEISLPGTELGSFETEDIGQIQAKFHSIQWRRLLLSQLQEKNTEVYFAVQDLDTDEYLQIRLITDSTRAEPVFQIDSNIQFEIANKEFFGFLTRKKTYDIVYKNINHSQVLDQLNLFLDGNLDDMKEQYRQLLHKKKLQEQRLV